MYNPCWILLTLKACSSRCFCQTGYIIDPSFCESIDQLLTLQRKKNSSVVLLFRNGMQHFPPLEHFLLYSNILFLTDDLLR
jgi:hypothetical protein